MTKVEMPTKFQTYMAVRAGCLLIAAALTLTCWGRVELHSGFAVVIGDWLDGRIQVAIAEHWVNVLRGVQAWNVVGYFYPWPDTLGYNDGFLLYGIFMAPFQAAGMDPFLAFECALGIVRLIGFVACWLLAADVFGLAFGWAVLAAVVFTLADNAYVQEGHAQLLGVSFAPLLGWLAWRMLRALAGPAPAWALPWSLVAGPLFGAWLLSAFYMAWFMTLFTLLAVGAATVLAGRGEWRAWCGLARWPLLPAAAILAACALPFLIVYLPKAAETHGHPIGETLSFTPSLFDLLHVGPGNLLFGGIDRWITRTLRPGFPEYGEHTIGFPPLLLVFGAAGVIHACSGRTPRPLLWRTLAIATVVSVLLFLRIRDATLWYYIYLYAPGAGAIRVVCRYAVFLALPLTLLAVGFLASRAPRWPVWITAACVAVLIAEQLTTTQAISLNRAAEMRLITAVPPTPPACRAFFVAEPHARGPDSNPEVERLYPQNVDAMIIGAIRGLPTINGFATFNPPDWDFASIRNSDYRARVRRYVEAHMLHQVCGLDLAGNRWETDPFR